VIVLAGVVFFAVPLLLFPAVLPENRSARLFAEALKDAAPFIGAIFITVAPFAAFRQIRRRKLFAACADVDSIRRLHWKEFETLVAETLRRVGYRVVEQRRSLTDSGPDLVASSADETLLVRCEHRRSATVGVATVRELKEAIAAEGAGEGAIVTSGTFSGEAISFAAGTSIQLIDGPQLEKLILSLPPHTQAKGETKSLRSV
jgi:restriction system protein